MHSEKQYKITYDKWTWTVNTRTLQKIVCLDVFLFI